MKKMIALFTVIMLCLSLCACGGGQAEETQTAETPDNSEPTPEQSENISEETIYNLGDVIETDLFRITPSFTGYAHELANWPDENFMTPEGQFSGESAYSATNGKVAI